MNDLVKNISFKQIIFNNRVYEFGFINDAIANLANFLTKNIRSQSPFIILPAHNHLKTIIVYYAILKAQKIAVVIDPELKYLEYEEIINDSQPAVIFKINIANVFFNYSDEVLFRDNCPEFEIRSDLKDVCTVAYTNAEDGFSKGAMLTSENLLQQTQTVVQINQLSSQSVTCALLGYSHMFGLIQGILVPAYSNSTALIVNLNLFRMAETMAEIEKHYTTHLYSVPSVFYIMSKVAGIDQYTQNIQQIYSGGVKLPTSVYSAFKQKTNRNILEGYGLTETCSSSTLNYPDTEPVVGSIGKAFPVCQVQIADETGKECKPETVGEIYIKGKIVFKGYFNQNEATLKTFNNGWLKTGDYGKQDLKGNFHFCGLKKSMINTGGNNVYPRKVERLLQMNPNVDKVNVFAEESLIQGHTVAATIKLRDNSNDAQSEFKNWCFQNISNAQLPKIWLFE